MGLAKILLAISATLGMQGKTKESLEYKERANALLLNNNIHPYPRRVLNQRQKRKRARW